MSTTAWIILVCAVAVVFLAGGIFAGYLYRKRVAEMKIAAAEDAARKIIEDGEKQAEAIKKEKLLEAKEENHKQRSELEKETRERRAPSPLSSMATSFWCCVWTSPMPTASLTGS